MFFLHFSNKSDQSESELEIGKKVILTHSQKEMEAEGNMYPFHAFLHFSNESDQSKNELELGKKVILTHSQKEMEG